jgi:NADPH2:quinone reductase
MKSLISADGGLALRETALPEPGPGELLVRVRAASLNRADLYVAAARTGKPFGMEWAGEVVAAGDGETGRIGERVIGTGMGGFAEYALLDAGRSIPLPQGWAFEEGSVLGLALQTMHDALVTNGQLRAGQSVLVHGASTAVGLMALQMARHMGASIIIGSSTSAAKRARLGDFGATHAVDSGSADWTEHVLQATGGRGVDLVIDQITGPRFDEVMRITAIRGRIINVGRLGGDSGPFNFDLHALRRLELIGVTFRTRSIEEVRSLNAALLRDLGLAIASGAFRLPIHSRFGLEQAPEALELMASNAHFGKIVLSLP